MPVGIRAWAYRARIRRNPFALTYRLHLRKTLLAILTLAVCERGAEERRDKGHSASDVDVYENEQQKFQIGADGFRGGQTKKNRVARPGPARRTDRTEQKFEFLLLSS